MKKIIIATSILLTLTACGSKTVYVTDTEVPNSPETTVKVVKTTDAPIATPAPTQAPAVWTDEDEFIADIYNENSGPIYLEDYDLIETGYAVCEGLRSGMSGYDAIDAIASSAEGNAAVEELLINVTASAVINFCPEQEYKFND